MAQFRRWCSTWAQPPGQAVLPWATRRALAGAVINTSLADVGNASCILRCNAKSDGVETLILDLPLPGTLVMELREEMGVGNYQTTNVLWGVQDPGASFKFESGTTDAGLVLLHDAIVGAYRSG